MDQTEDVSRRAFLRTATGATAVATAAGTAAAQEEGEGEDGGGGGGGQPDFGGYTDDAENGDFEDARGQDEVTVEVGAGSSELAFAPTELWIDPGTEVTFEWVSNGHNVIPESQPDEASWGGSGGESELFDEGYSFSSTFETNGIYTYYCSPHLQSGMLGGIAVGDDVPTAGGGGGGSAEPDVPAPAKSLGVATMFAMASTLGLAYLFMKYGGDYGAVDEA